MTSSPTRPTQLHVTAEIVIDGPPDAAPLSQTTPTDSLVVSGQVIQARTGTALQGQRVVAFVDGGSLGVSTPLGTAISDADGRFQIQFDTSPSVRDQLLLLSRSSGKSLRLRVDSADGRELVSSAPVPLDQPTIAVTLAVPLPDASVAPSDWATLGGALQQARIAHLDEVATLLKDGLLAPGIQNLAPTTRQAMLAQMEQAFLDPTGLLREVAGDVPFLQELHDLDFVDQYTRRLQDHLGGADVRKAYADMLGKAATFGDLAAVDWLIDPSALYNADVGGALTKFSDRYRIEPDDWRVLARESDLTRYRDYLLAIWTSHASQIQYVRDVKLSPDEALQQLENRFHQRFTTYDDNPVNAIGVLAQILRGILVAPTGKGFGFAIAAADIAPQGAQAPRAYLDYLIGLTGLSAQELGLRYRLDFTRSDAALSSPVQENIATLQGFFRDSFQCSLDPFHIDPDKHNQPIIPDVWSGNAPFFLYYDEWLRQQQPFYPENHLDIRNTLKISMTDKARTALADVAGGKYPSESANVPLWKFYQNVVEIWDKLQEGHNHYRLGEYGLARVAYERAQGLAQYAMQDNILQANTPVQSYNFRKKLPLATFRQLAHFMNPSELADGGFMFPTSPNWARDHIGLRLAYYALFTIPVCLGDAELALGDYEHAIFHYGQATRFAVGMARETDPGGYRPQSQSFIGPVVFEMYWRGDKPHTVRLTAPGPSDNSIYLKDEPVDEDHYDNFYDTSWYGPVEEYAIKWSRRIPHQAEVKLFRLKQANAMLEWADALYRLNEPSSVARARELYKGVLWLYGERPPISPTWPQDGLDTGVIFLHGAENPALVSQTTRAWRGVYQIDHGLNYYGEPNDIVPILRYRPLKETADRMAGMARSAQQDFMQYTERVEAAIKNGFQLANFLQKAKLQTAIADEQQAIAQHELQVAQDQVAAVRAAIKAKQDEIAKADSLFGQISDAFKSVKSIVTDLPGDTKSAVSAGVVSEATGKEMVGQGMLGLGAGAS